MTQLSQEMSLYLLLFLGDPIVTFRLYVPFKYWHLLIMSTLKLSPLSITLKISPLIFELSEMNLCLLADQQTRDQHKLCTLFYTDYHFYVCLICTFRNSVTDLGYLHFLV